MEAEAGRSSTRTSFPVYKGDWNRFVKNCMAEAHASGVNEALMVAAKAHKKGWDWPFAPDPRQEIIQSSDDKDETPAQKPEIFEVKTRAQTAQVHKLSQSKWERFPANVAEAARYQSQRLYRCLDRALGSPSAVNFQSQLASVPEDDGIGAWLMLLRWSATTIAPVREREEALDKYHGIKLKSLEYPESLWTRLETTRKQLKTMQIDIDEGATERRFIKAIHESRKGRYYHDQLQQYKLAERQGKNPTMDDLRVALTVKYEELQLGSRGIQHTWDRNPNPLRPAAAAVQRGNRGSMPVELAKPTHKKGTNTARHAKHREQVCKNCGAKGHHWQRCKQPKKCLICHEQDHLAAACPTNSSDKDYSPPPRSHCPRNSAS